MSVAVNDSPSRAAVATATLSEVCKIVNGATPKTGISEYWGGDNQWVTPAEMGKRSTPFVAKTKRSLTATGLENCSASLLPPSSVILSSRAPIGHLVINEVPMAFNQGCKGLIPGERLHFMFLYYFLLSSVEYLDSLGTGATFKELSAGKLKGVSMPVPPLPEQERIVAILDEAFAGIATATAHAERNLHNARELFQSVLQSTFEQKGEDWVETTVGDQITLQRGFDITKKQQRPGDVPVVSSGGVKSHHDTAKAAGPGVVVGRKGTIGKVHFLDTEYWPHDTTLWVKDFKENEPRLIYYLLSGLDLAKLDSGAANPALNRNLVHPLRISWPVKDTQKSIVQKLDALAAETRRLEAVYQRKLDALAELKQSLLQRAFAGEL